MSYQAHVTEVHYTDTARNSDKYYRVYRLWDGEEHGDGDHRVVFNWGRRGAKGQSSVQVFPNARSAQLAVLKKLSEKTAKGYREVYDKELPGVDHDVMAMAGINDFGRRTNVVSENPFVRISVEVDTIRRLAMGDQDDVVEAITKRSGLLAQLDELRTSVLRAEGEVEIVDMILGAKVGA